MNINQPVLFCRGCSATYEDINEEGVCNVCETPNILREWSVIVTLSSVGYTEEEAMMKLISDLNHDPTQFFNAVYIKQINPEEG